jgi:hypothetical protein
VLPLPVVLLPAPLPEPVVPLVDEPEPVVERSDDVEPVPDVPYEDELPLDPGDADGEVPSFREHAVAATTVTSAKNSDRALVMSHLLSHRACHPHAINRSSAPPGQGAKLRRRWLA